MNTKELTALARTISDAVDSLADTDTFADPGRQEQTVNHLKAAKWTLAKEVGVRVVEGIE